MSKAFLIKICLNISKCINLQCFLRNQKYLKLNRAFIVAFRQLVSGRLGCPAPSENFLPDSYAFFQLHAYICQTAAPHHAARTRHKRSISPQLCKAKPFICFHNICIYVCTFIHICLLPQYLYIHICRYGCVNMYLCVLLGSQICWTTYFGRREVFQKLRKIGKNAENNSSKAIFVVMARLS